jgi:hypothetical protein
MADQPVGKGDSSDKTFAPTDRRVGPDVGVKTTEEAKTEDSSEVLAKIQEILAKHGNQETNIPVGSNYWVLMNQYRALLSEEKLRNAGTEENK